MSDADTAGLTPAPERSGPPSRPAPVRDGAQYGLAAFLAVAGLVVLRDAVSLERGFADQPVQPYAFGYVVGTVLLLLSVVLAVATYRGDRPTAEEGEDVDLTAGSDWATVVKLAAVFVVVVLTLEWLGWAIVGAGLFAAAARILGSRTLLLDVAIGTALSLLTWYGFYVGLGIPIPAGILDGVL